MPPAASQPSVDPDASRLVEAAFSAAVTADRPPPTTAPSFGATTLLLRVAGDVRSMQDLSGRIIATADPDPDHRQRMAAALRSLRITLDLLALPSLEAETRLQAGSIAALASLANDETAAGTPDDVLKIRLDDYAGPLPPAP